MASNFPSDGRLFMVSGPSGGGKTTLIEAARARLEPLGISLHFSVSHTTRKPRAGEVDGRDYYFVDSETFRAMIERGEFLEWAHVLVQRYGPSKLVVLSRLVRGEDGLL